MRDFTKRPLGQESAFLMGLLFLFFGLRSLVETIETHAWVFRFRRLSEVQGALAAILIAICLFAGAYLVSTAYKRMRA